MQHTGIVRRIDDLGRIVIPKEIRRKLNIRDGDPLELFTDGTDVIWKKYSPLSITQFIDAAAAVLRRNDITYAIYDCDQQIVTNSDCFLANLSNKWYGKRNVFQDGILTVFPVIYLGEIIGYIATKDIGDKAIVVTTVIQMVVEQMDL